MNRSKPGLNEPFYKWLDDVRRAIRKEKELLEKLEFYNMKFVGYKGVNYERIGTSSSSGSGDKELLYWLEKIDFIEMEIKFHKLIIYEYYAFHSILNEREKKVLEYDYAKIYNVSNSSISNFQERKYIKNQIKNKWFKLVTELKIETKL